MYCVQCTKYYVLHTMYYMEVSTLIMCSTASTEMPNLTLSGSTINITVTITITIDINLTITITITITILYYYYIMLYYCLPPAGGKNLHPELIKCRNQSRNTYML